LLKAIAFQSNPAKHGGFSGLAGMKQARMASNEVALNDMTPGAKARIDTPQDKPENSLGEIDIQAKPSR
jgi:hypothetical protein